MSTARTVLAFAGFLLYALVGVLWLWVTVTLTVLWFGWFFGILAALVALPFMPFYLLFQGSFNIHLISFVLLALAWGCVKLAASLPDPRREIRDTPPPRRAYSPRVPPPARQSPPGEGRLIPD
jgi:hypothetical protein